ncbi:MAG: anaerobic ribonucleoside-triphosphate reductase activating protein [Chloroflexi bacterium]|nr:MAG: anaerobic ribonucleoside-triphosphate reductase activating protein [Chloroflexota bacterium]
MKLKGWVRTSLIDYPGHIATVLFTGGCDFRCPMCHNADLVLRPGELPTLPLEEVWDFLSRRARLMDGVAITGGEPTLQADLLPFLRQVRALGLDVKLDSNGYNPDVLASLLDGGLVDYVAMDVKAPPAKYPRLAGLADLDLQRIEQSVALLRGGNVSYEFRTTVVPGLLDVEDIEEIARWIAGAERYVLQQFRPLGTLDPSLEKTTPYPMERLQAMAKRAGRWVNQVTVRGSP